MNTTRARLLQEMGITPVWRLRRVAAVEEVEAQEPQATQLQEAPPPVAESFAPPAAFSGFPSSEERGQRIAALEWPELEQEIRSCAACGLCAKRKQAVPGVGDKKAQWLFIGEGPGAEEDIQGEPFVGQAGKLLDAMLAAINLKREANVYIANAVKCRPPGNRTPETGEIAICGPFLRRQIALIRPRLIVLLGRVATHAVLNREVALNSLRGKPHEYRDGDFSCPVIVTWHPAYLLRNLPDKRRAWEDLCLARETIRQGVYSESTGVYQASLSEGGGA
ncbi:MAG: uracil-DNA glycosylase [Betaproteobacteria bacterium]|nr:uracil-DNA glycosylase [Betaproteobacteria bacterium]